jgi:hypothetical protein
MLSVYRLWEFSYQHAPIIVALRGVGEFMDETPRDIKNTAHKPPVFFLGRNAKVQEVSICLSTHET